MLDTSKWTKYKILSLDDSLLPFLPKTKWLKEQSLHELLAEYGSVVLKPTAGGGGAGIMKVSCLQGDRISVHSGRIKTEVQRDRLFSELLKKMKTTNYIVQQLIPLATIGERPFDLRVMVQRNNANPWTVTGKLAKVAGTGYMITNVARSQGLVVPIEAAVQRSNIEATPIKKIQQQIDEVALRSVQQLQQYYPNIQIVGMDMGLDRAGNVWVIEANFRPADSLFQKLKDKRMYQKIVTYRKLQ